MVIRQVCSVIVGYRGSMEEVKGITVQVSCISDSLLAYAKHQDSEAFGVCHETLNPLL